MIKKPKAAITYGFTLLEMSIVLIIISVVAVGVMVIFAQSLSMRQVSDTKTKLAAIQNAIYEYRLVNNRIPCPADVTLDITDTYFGVEGVAAGDCATGSTYVSGARTVAANPGPTANFIQNPAVGAQDAREGLVPVRTLRLPDNYAFDSWGARIMYAVAKDMTQLNACGIIAGNDATTRMTVNNAAGTASTTQAAYVLLSFGPDKHGAYPRNVGNTRLSYSSTNTDELQNCDCNSSAVTTGLDGIFVQKEATVDPSSHFKSFDDIVVYGTRADLILQPSLYWSVLGTSANLICTKNNLSCTTVGSVKSCTCNQ